MNCHWLCHPGIGIHAHPNITITMTMEIFYLTVILHTKKTLYRINVTFIQVTDWSGDYY